MIRETLVEARSWDRQIVIESPVGWKLGEGGILTLLILYLFILYEKIQYVCCDPGFAICYSHVSLIAF